MNAADVFEAAHADSTAPVTHTFKILVTGAFEAGTTSLIRSVSRTDLVSADVITSGEGSDVDARTVVTMDFGTCQVDDDAVSLSFFGTPGDARFRFMTDTLKGDVDIVVFVIDAEARHTHDAAGVELRSVLADLAIPAVVAINRCDEQQVADRLARALGAPVGHPVVPCQLIDAASGRKVVIEALLTLLHSMERGEVTRHDG